MDYILSCSSTADMPASYFEEHQIPVVFFHYILNGKEYKDDFGQSINYDEFYKKIDEGAMPTTSQVTVGQYLEFFEAFLKEGKDILHLEFSGGLSGSYNSGLLARQELLEQYPDRKIIMLDTYAASGGYGLLLDKALTLKNEGMGIDELHQWVEDHKLTVHHWFFTTDLTHFKRGGRVSATSAFVGNLLNICPLLNVSHEGKLTPREKIRGKRKVIEATFKKMKENALDGLDYSGKCFITQSASYDDARALADLIEENFKNLDGKVQINNIGTVVGSHTGPGTVALFFFGKERVD